jgi:radical SAM-linked protein
VTAQRYRVWFRKGERVRFISHLDVLRYWERAIRRTGLPLSYSQGFTPHPKLAFAAPLPLGFTAEREVVDVTLDERVPEAEFRERLAPETSEDLALVDVEEVPATTPAPQAVLLWADYRVDLPQVDAGSARAAVEPFMRAERFDWTEEKREKSRTYDLRAAVATLCVQPVDGGSRLEMRLRADSEMTGRPEQVVAALFPGEEPVNIVRTGLVLDEPSPARNAWLRRGRFQG